MDERSRIHMKYTIDEIASQVKVLILESLDREGEECSLSTRLIEDLDAESLDYLDIAFRIERTYNVRIQRGRVEKDLRARLPDMTIKPNTEATPELKALLREFMPEVPPKSIDAIGKVKDVARLFTVGTFVRTAILAIRETFPDAKILGEGVDGYEPSQLGVLYASAEQRSSTEP
jgi:acyl carrier protein